MSKTVFVITRTTDSWSDGTVPVGVFSSREAAERLLEKERGVVLDYFQVFSKDWDDWTQEEKDKYGEVLAHDPGYYPEDDYDLAMDYCEASTYKIWEMPVDD
jgi:hypothetical protein